MRMYILLEYSDNYSITSASLWSYYKDEVNDADNEIVASSECSYIKKNSFK